MSDRWEQAALSYAADGPMGQFIFDSEAKVVYANDAACNMLGRSRDVLVGSMVFELIHPDDWEVMAAAGRALGSSDVEQEQKPNSGRVSRGIIFRMQLPNGRPLEVLATAKVLGGVDDEIAYLLAFLAAPPRLAVLGAVQGVAAGASLDDTFMTMMSEIAHEENKATISWIDPEGTVRLFGNVEAVMAGVDPDGTRNTWPTSPWHIAATTGEQVWSSNPSDFPPEVAAAAAAEGYTTCCVSPLPDPASGTAMLYINWTDDDGSVAYLKTAFNEVMANTLQVALNRAHDQAKLTFAALHDQLTGLFNRRAFFDALAADHERGPVSVLYLDLDGFKPINDELGHDAGDQALIAVARRLETCLGTAGTLARFGGDEFAIAVPSTDRDAVEQLAERIVVDLGRPLDLPSYGPVAVGMSIGVATSDDVQPSGPDSLVLAADDLLREAKRRGKGTWVAAPA